MAGTAIEYRAYIVGSDGHFTACRAYVCNDDADAMKWASQLDAGRDVELWSGPRFLARLEKKVP